MPDSGVVDLPGGAPGPATYTIPAGEARILEAAEWLQQMREWQGGSPLAVPTVIVRDESGHLVARVTATAEFPG